jgi:glycosyltransferase involved in cell wall biosynthesis
VLYPRILWYPVTPLKQYAYRSPGLQMNVAWQSARSSLSKAVREFKPDVLYAHHTAVNGYFAAKLMQSTEVPFVVTDHDFGEISDCEQLPNRKRFFADITSRSSMMVAVASRMEQRLRQLFPGVRACTVPNGTEGIPDALKKTERPPDLRGKTILFSCGTFYERKGFPLLIEAFAQVAANFPAAVLRIAGDGEQRPQLEELVQQFGLQERVQLLGFLPHAAVMQEMSWCDVFALIGWDEPFATVFSEALSAGKPVICCNDGGITDVLKNEVHGLTVPPRNAQAAAVAICRLLRDPDLRERMGKAGAELFERSLRWDHNAARMEQLFRAAVQDSRGSVSGS